MEKLKTFLIGFVVTMVACAIVGLFVWGFCWFVTVVGDKLGFAWVIIITTIIIASFGGVYAAYSESKDDTEEELK